jgi:hypothetical protein
MAEEVEACLRGLQDLDDDMTLRRSERRAVEADRLEVCEDGHLVLQLLADWVKCCVIDFLPRCISFFPAGMDRKLWAWSVGVFITSLMVLVFNVAALISCWV